MSNLETFLYYFENWALLDIELILNIKDIHGKMYEPDRTGQEYHRPFIAAAILICCAVDCLAAYRFGREDGDNSGNQFKNFIHDYFPDSYDKDLIYKNMRSTLVHGYSTKGVALDHTTPDMHLKKKGKNTVFDIYFLFNDLKSAFNKYKSELEAGHHLKDFERRYSSYPIIQSVPKANLN